METITTATNTKWILDPAHSELVFKVKHLMISTVTGQFRDFQVTAATPTGEFSDPADIEVTAEIASIDTNNAQRDEHLRSADFFDAGNHARLVFKGTRYEPNGDDSRLFGDLTIRGITKGIVVQVEPGGVATDPYGQVKAGFNVTGKISRKEFGLTWNGVTEAGGVVVGDEIKFHAAIQLIKQA